MEAEVCRPRDLGREDTQKWQEWQAADLGPGGAFLSYTFAKAIDAVRHDVRVAVISDGAERTGFFAFQQGRLGVGRALGLGVSDRQGPIHAPGVELDPIDLIRASGLGVWEFDHIGPDAIGFSAHVATWSTGALMDISEGYDQYLEKSGCGGGRYVKSAMQKKRKMARERGEVTLDFDTKDEDAFKQLLEWKSQQYKRTGRSDRFAKTWISNLAMLLFETRESDCTGVVSVLRAGDDIAAVHFGLKSNDEMSMWFPAYDIELSRYSPGALLFLMMAEKAPDYGVKTMDLGKGDEDYKSHLRSSSYRIGEGSVMTPSAGAAASWLRHTPKRTVEDFVLSHDNLRLGARKALAIAGKVRR